MKNGMSNIVRQAQKMQSQIQRVQEEIGRKKIEASTGGGMVTAVVNGNGELLSVKINPEVVDPKDVESLEEMVLGSVRQAMETASKMMNTEVEKVTGGLSIPGFM